MTYENRSRRILKIDTKGLNYAYCPVVYLYTAKKKFAKPTEPPGNCLKRERERERERDEKECVSRTFVLYKSVFLAAYFCLDL